MSMPTIYVLIGPDREVAAVAASLDATEALRELSYSSIPGQVFACRISEGGAVDVRNAALRKGKTSAITLLKLYSYSMNHCSDVT